MKLSGRRRKTVHVRTRQYVVLDSSSIYDADSSALRMLETLVSLISERQYPVEILIAHGPESFMQQVRETRARW